jgi:hypothetical protein
MSSRAFRYTASAPMLTTSLLAGCSCSSGGGDDDVKVVQQQSYGQQLIDLDAARQKGLLTDKEYEKSRKAIIEKMKK